MPPRPTGTGGRLVPTCVDDRDATDRLWPGRGDRCFALRWMLDEGVRLAMGSDAPVARLDPWLAVTAAVHRSVDGREPWYADQAITLREALAASTDGWGTVAPGHPGDLVLLEAMGGGFTWGAVLLRW